MRQSAYLEKIMRERVISRPSRVTCTGGGVVGLGSAGEASFSLERL